MQVQNGRFGYVDKLFTVSDGKSGVIREGENYDNIPLVYPHLISEVEHLGYSIAGDAYEE